MQTRVSKFQQTMQCDTYEPKHLIILYIHIYNTYKHKNLSVVNIWNSSNKLVIYGEVSKANNQWLNGTTIQQIE